MADHQAPIALDDQRKDVEAERVQLRLRARVLTHVAKLMRNAMKREEILRLSAARSAEVEVDLYLFCHTHPTRSKVPRAQ